MLKRRAVFFLESGVLRGPLFRVGMILALLGLLTLAGGGIAMLIEGDEFSSGLFGAAWWAALRISDPGYLADDDASGRLALLSLCLSLIGSAFLVGGVAAVMTQWLTSKLSRLTLGLSHVPFEGHSVVVGWCDRCPHIIQQLCVDEKKSRIVVLSEQSPETIRSELASLLTASQLQRVVPRTGSPRKSAELARAAPARAARVILPTLDKSLANSVDRGSRRLRELAAIRVCLNQHEEGQESNAASPELIVELADPALTEFARSITPEATFILGDHIVAQALVETVEGESQCLSRPTKTMLVGASGALLDVIECLHLQQTPREVHLLFENDEPDQLPAARRLLNAMGEGGITSLEGHRAQVDSFELTASEFAVDLSVYDELIVLACRGIEDESVTDDRTLATAIALSTVRPAIRSDARVVLELLDEDSEGIVDPQVARQLVTPRVVGRALARGRSVELAPKRTAP